MDPSIVLSANEPENRSRIERRSSRLSTDWLLDTLANPLRRRVIRCLFEREGALAFERLVSHVAAREVGIDVHDVDPDDYETTRIALYHSQLPKLIDSGVIVFDRETETVEPGPELFAAATCLDAFERAHDAAY